MTPDPLTGVLFHWLGGLASASFYVPYRGVRRWSWEVFWLTGGLFSWLFAPWLFAALMTEDLLGVLRAASPATLMWCGLFGALWGFGGLTYGLTVRYLGVGLGTAIALGLTAAFGTLIPPLVAGELGTLLGTRGGLIVLGGVVVCLIGITIVGMAGRAKEKDRAADAAPREASFRKGVLVAIFCGVMSSCFAYGLAAGAPIRELTLAAGTGPLWQGLPVLCVVLVGGVLTNLVWAGLLIARNGSVGQLIGRGAADDSGERIPLLRNYLLCALGGLTWYLQFFFYTMGESQMGAYGFSSWTLHMASIIIFASLWGLALKEWRGSAGRTRALLGLGVLTLVGSTVIIGYGNASSLG